MCCFIKRIFSNFLCFNVSMFQCFFFILVSEFCNYYCNQQQLNKIKQAMLKFFNRFCGDSLSCPFQKALRNCTYSDWTIPSDSDIQYLIRCLSGIQVNTIRAQKAFTIFRLKFQNNQQKSNAAFLLKNLYILEKCVQERVILDLIAHYQNNRLFYDKALNPQNQAQVQAIKQFVGSYYLYIKKKALIYQKINVQIFVNRKRASFIKSITKTSQLFELIDNCFQIQKFINQANQKINKCNRNALFIQNILVGLLKVYLFCYSTVSLSIQALVSKIQLFKNSQLSNFLKLIKYYNKQYTNSFLAFLEGNKSIEVFKAFKYSELIRIDQTYVKIVQNLIKLKNIENIKLSFEDSFSTKKGSKDSIEDQDKIQQSQFLNINNLPEDLLKSLTLQMKFSYKQRKTIEIILSNDAAQYQKAFDVYPNYYSENMIQEEKIISQGGEANMNSSLVLSKKKSKNLKKTSVMEQLVNSKLKKSNSLRQKQIQLLNMKFNQKVWDSWQNIYAF